MRLTHLLPLAAVAGAFLIPDEKVASQIVLQDENSEVSSAEPIQSIDDYIYDTVFDPENTFPSFVESSENALDDALSFASNGNKKAQCMKSMQGFDVNAWLDGANNPYGILDLEDDYYDEEDYDGDHYDDYDDGDFAAQEGSFPTPPGDEPAPPLPPGHEGSSPPLPPPPPHHHHNCTSPRHPKFNCTHPPPWWCHRRRWRHPHWRRPHCRPPHHGPPHHGPPHHGPPHHGPPDVLESRPPHHGHGPHHGHKSNLTIWQLISSSKYTSKLAKLLSKDAHLVEVLNSTGVNITVFAPTNAALEKIPKHGKKPPKELILKILRYHAAHGLYPARRLFGSHTIPSALVEERLGGEPQRLRVSIGLGGLRINFRSRIVAANIVAANGIIHGIDNIILLPPPALKIIGLLPGEFSTLQLGLVKTGLEGEIEDSGHIGGTLFAPSNVAFKRLGPKINAFLFSKYGLKYLKALLEYHIVPDTTLYSDAIYTHKLENSTMILESPRRGIAHVDLPTLLADKYLSIDIARWGRFITMKINGFSTVSIQDGIAKDGVIHVVPRVLIPPKTPGGRAEDFKEDELSVEELMERLSPYVDPDASEL